MANPLITTATGPVSATYNSQDTGVLEGVFTASYQFDAEPVAGQNKWGTTEIDHLITGISRVRILAVYKEWTDAVKAMLWPFTTAVGTFPAPGFFATAYAKEFKLTALAGSLRATNMWTTRTFDKVLIAPGQESRFELGPTQQLVPIELIAYPSVAGQNNNQLKFWTDA